MTAIQQAINELKYGNRTGIEYIYQHFKNLLFKLGVETNLSFEDAEDLMSETFSRLPKIMAKFEYKNDGAFIHWLITVHNNAIKGYFRDNRLEFSHLDDYEWGQIEVVNDRQNEDKRLGIIREELEKLPENDRILINMRAKNIPYKTISEILGIHHNTLKVRYLRESQKLDNKLKNKFNELKLL